MRSNLIILGLCASRIVSGELRFAFVKGNLYTKIESSFMDRAEQTTYSLLQLSKLNPPDVYGAIGSGIHNDGAGATLQAKIAFSRSPDDNLTILWPEYDTFGDPFAFIAPYEIMLRQFEMDMPRWDHRTPVVYWSGSFSGGGGIREALYKCSQDNPDTVHVKLTDDWESPVPDLPLGSHGLFMKPIRFDLRQLLRYQFVVYVWGNGWSSSNKRILASGGTIFYPSADRAESYYAWRLRTECVDCLTYYDSTQPYEENMCNSLLNITASLPRAVARTRAENARRFVYKEFRHDALFQYMRSVLNELDSIVYEAGMEGKDAIVIDGHELRLTTCRSNIERHTGKIGGEKRAWQLHQWYDSECSLQKDTDYLMVSAI